MNKPDAAKILLDRGATLKQLSGSRETLVRYASTEGSTKGHAHVIKVLAEIGADLSATDDISFKARYYTACLWTKYEVVKALLSLESPLMCGTTAAKHRCSWLITTKG